MNGPLLFVTISLLLAVVVAGAYWLNTRRQRPLAALAAAQGWTYRPRPFSPRFRLTGATATGTPWELDTDPRRFSVLHWRAKTAVLPQALILIQGKETPPQMTLEMSGDVAGTMATWAAARVDGRLHQIPHGSDTFQARFAIRGTDKTAVLQHVTPAVQQALLDWYRARNGRDLPVAQIGPQGVKLTARIPLTPEALTALIQLGETVVQQLTVND